MAELVFFSGTMDCGKSTLALQMDHNHRQRGRQGLIFTRLDRAGSSTLSSRLGLSTAAVEVTDELDFWDVVADERIRGNRVDYLICDEVQFYTPVHAEQLARVVDELGVDVFAFGITADFRTRLFPGSQRLIELADRVQVLQVGPVLVRRPGHPQRPHAQRSDGGRGAAGRRGRHRGGGLGRLRGPLPPPPHAPDDRRLGRGGARLRPGGRRAAVRPGRLRAPAPHRLRLGDLLSAAPIR
jgi:thymidine kinase